MTSTYNLLVAISESHHLDQWQRLARRLLPEGGEIHLRGMVTIPPERSLSEGATSAREFREAFRESLQTAALESGRIHDEVQVYVDYEPFRRVMEDVAALTVDLLLVQWPAPLMQIGGLDSQDVLDSLPCDVVLVGGENWFAPGDVLLSLRGGPNMTLGMRVAQALAEDHSITLFHAADQRRAAPDLELLIRAVPNVSRTVTAVTGIADGIAREAAGHKAIVMGSTFRRPDPASGTPIVEQIHARTHLPLMLVRGLRQEAFDFHPPQTLPRGEERLSVRVDRWFAENTFHSDEFSSLRDLMAMKERQGVTISVALPALNEEATVGQVISTLKSALMDEVPLVDEIVLIDSDSTDRTREIAAALGVPVHIHQQTLTEVGAVAGKGEALWKSLYVTRGDIIAWVDTDITNIHPRFIYGLLGPLLKSPRVQYVKGFYARPIKVGEKMQAYGGGRVTELVARPLFNLFYPELSGIIQPLSGEYAGRRTALEHVPFFSGYGVETGLLIDLLERYSLDAIAQSDLEVRVHHNQPLVNLSKMSFAILQVFFARIESRYGVPLLERANRSMKLVVQEPDRFALDIAEIGDTERPPIVTLAAYQRRQRVEAAR
jgi:glucosyl-3-phosphoglycerate synthase